MNRDIPRPLSEAILVGTPGDSLCLAIDELGDWAEHITWCYRFLDIGDGATVAVQDFGASPLSLLASSLFLPIGGGGVAERLNGRVICLDASVEKVILTPAALRQVRPDALVMRADMAPLLVEQAKRDGVRLDGARMVLVVSDERSVAMPDPAWDLLLLVGGTLLIAPGCRVCRHFHLREGVYAVADGAVVNLGHPSAAPYRSSWLDGKAQRGCPTRPGDWLLPVDRYVSTCWSAS